jgi:hypothetical protein
MQLITIARDYRFSAYEMDDLTEAAYFGGLARAFLMDAELEMHYHDGRMFDCNAEIAIRNARYAASHALSVLGREPSPQSVTYRDLIEVAAGVFKLD